jgi:hypothetical protein
VRRNNDGEGPGRHSNRIRMDRRHRLAQPTSKPSIAAAESDGRIHRSAMTQPLSAAVPSNARRRSSRTQAAGAGGLSVPHRPPKISANDESRVETSRRHVSAGKRPMAQRKPCGQQRPRRAANAKFRPKGDLQGQPGERAEIARKRTSAEGAGCARSGVRR